jgi:hypothetical protein
MRRLSALAVLAIVLAAAGCGGSGSPAPPLSPAAPVQRAQLGWVERTAATGSAFVFRVHSFAVTAKGWKADVSVTNGTPTTFLVAPHGVALEDALGIMLFSTGLHGELEDRIARNSLPAVRPVHDVTPALPATLPPDTTWSGTISAPGALPSGLWVRFSFGAYVPRDGMPPALEAEGVRDELVWITDHAYRLR